MAKAYKELEQVLGKDVVVQELDTVVKETFWLHTCTLECLSWFPHQEVIDLTTY
jgi:hypothetical protein